MKNFEIIKEKKIIYHRDMSHISTCIVDVAYFNFKFLES